MLLTLTRDIFTADATLSTVTVDGLTFGFCVEDEDRGLEAGGVKVRAETAIPIGRYKLAPTWSNRFKREMLLVHDVPGFQGIRVHPGNSEADTEGCLLLGLSRDPQTMRIGSSVKACAWMDAEVRRRLAKGEACEVLIQRDPAAWSAYRAQAR